MAKDKLMVVKNDYDYQLQWWLAEDDDMGLTIGELRESDLGPEPQDREEWENWVAHRIAAESDDVLSRQDGEAFLWDSQRAVKAALAQIKLAWKTKVRELPEWAKTALAAGWKAPKGWKP